MEGLDLTLWVLKRKTIRKAVQQDAEAFRAGWLNLPDQIVEDACLLSGVDYQQSRRQIVEDLLAWSLEDEGVD